jgi:WD40 repeat protein
MLFAVYEGNHASLWNITTKKQLADFQETKPGKKPLKGEEVTRGTITPDGWYLMTGTGGGALCIWDIHAHLIRYRFVHPKGISAIAVSRDGRSVLAADYACQLVLYKLERPFFDDPNQPPPKRYVVTNAQPAYTIKNGNDVLYSIAISPDGRSVVTGSSNNDVTLWDLASRKPVRVMKGHTTSVGCVVIFADGQRAASVSFDRTLRIWNLSTGECTRIIKYEGEYLMDCLAITPDGRYAVMGDRNGFFDLWDLDAGKRVLQKDRVAGLTSATFNRDGTRLITGHYFAEIAIYDFKPEG